MTGISVIKTSAGEPVVVQAAGKIFLAPAGYVADLRDWEFDVDGKLTKAGSVTFRPVAPTAEQA